MKLTRIGLVPLAMLGAMVVAGGVAYATIGDGGAIQGCYDSGGNLKVVAALPCPKGYTALSWNQQGPSGPSGPSGAKGEKGDRGPAGAVCEEKMLIGGTNSEDVISPGVYSLARQTSPGPSAIDTAVCPGTLKNFSVTTSAASTGWRFDIAVNGTLTSARCSTSFDGVSCTGADVSISIGDEIYVSAGKPGPSGGGTGPSATWSADFIPGPTIP